MLELYQAYGNYQTMMDVTEGLIVAGVDALGAGRTLPYGETSINFSPPWERASYSDLFNQHVGVRITDIEAVRREAEATGFPAANKHPDVVIHHLFEARVEPHLTGPLFVYDYPASLCPLTK